MNLKKISKYNFNLLLAVLSMVAINIGFFAINIFFILIPFFEKNKKILILPKVKVIRYGFFYFLLIGLVGFIFYCFKIDQISIIPIRQLISFILFLSIFSLSFYPSLNIDKNFLFKALFISSLINFLLSLWMIQTNSLDIFSLSPESASTFKYLIKQHGTGHVFSFAFVAALFGYKFFRNFIMQSLIVIISLLGIILTFSRSSLISLALGLVSYLVMIFIDTIIKRKFYISFLSKSFGFFPNKFFKILIPFSFLTVILIKLFEIISQNFYLIFNVLNSLGLSERIRIERWSYAWDFAIMHPFTGSSFLGVWAFHDVYGSIHSSFFDVLFRTGIIGFIFYVALLTDLIIFYFVKKEFILASGVFCLIGYGISYEALLWPSGLCLMAILINIRCKERLISS